MSADHRRSEAGAALVFALIFMVLGSVLALGLANFASNSMRTTISVTGQRSIEYAADGGMNAAIQSVRYIVGTRAGSCPSFPSSSTTVTFNNQPVNVSCSWVSTGFAQWTVDFSARICSSFPCTGQPVSTARVVYYLTDPAGDPSPGAVMKVTSWVVASATS